MIVLQITVSEFLEFIEHSPWAYLWMGAITVGMFVICFLPNKKKS